MNRTDTIYKLLRPIGKLIVDCKFKYNYTVNKPMDEP